MVGKLIRDNCRIELLNHDDGLRGPYDPTDPEDVKVFRFIVFFVDEEKGWTELASHPTHLPRHSSFEDQEKALRLIMDKIHSPLLQGQDIQGLCEELSWISPDWLEEEYDALALHS